MTYYEIYYYNNVYQIWKWTNNGCKASCELYKTYKTRKGAENWAKTQWCRVTWK